MKSTTRSFVCGTFSLCSLFLGCAPKDELFHTGQEYRSHDDSGRLAAAVQNLELIGSEFEQCKECDFPDEKVTAALNLAGFERDYFSMDDFLEVLTKYQSRFGNDRYFYGAAKLAYSYSDGEYAGRFENRFPEMVRHFQN